VVSLNQDEALANPNPRRGARVPPLVMRLTNVPALRKRYSQYDSGGAATIIAELENGLSPGTDSSGDGIALHKRLSGLVASLPSRIGRPTTRTSYSPQIDGIRFLAIALVVIWHISLRASRFTDYINQKRGHVHGLYNWFPHGEVGVALFFFISGYVIVLPFLSRPKDQWRIGRFYLQRARRIYPPYLVAITGCFVIVTTTGVVSGDLGVSVVQSWAASLFYLHGLLYDAPSRLNPPIWSLEVEIQFYLIAPAIISAYMWPRRGNARILVGSLTVIVLILVASSVDFIYPFDGRFRFGLLAHLYLFMAGIVAADLAQLRLVPFGNPSRSFDALLVVGLLLLTAIGLYLTRVDARPGGGWPDILCDFGLLAAVLAISFGAMAGHIGQRILGGPWLSLIGTMCFSIYLTHVVVVEAMTSLLRRLPLHHAAAIWGIYILVLAPASLAVGLVYYVVIERPFMTPYPLKAARAVLSRRLLLKS
jgi:peptidoglycan/LPS O-acetylase OafA/YrhL